MQSEMWCKESIMRAPLLQRYDVQPAALTHIAISGILWETNCIDNFFYFVLLSIKSAYYNF